MPWFTFTFTGIITWEDLLHLWKHLYFVLPFSYDLWHISFVNLPILTSSIYQFLNCVMYDFWHYIGQYGTKLVTLSIDLLHISFWAGTDPSPLLAEVGQKFGQKWVICQAETPWEVKNPQLTIKAQTLVLFAN